MTVGGNNEEIGGTAISRSIWTWARLAGGAAILAVLVWRVGAGPFVDGLRLTTAWALAAAMAITSLTTLCCAWRWSLVAGGLGVDVPLRRAVSAYYRSQFLNSTLPGGVLGDVHRGVLHGRAVGDLGRGLRSVAWERASGQAVQALLTVAVLLLLPPPAGSLRLVVAWVVAAVAGVALVVVLLRLKPGRLPTRIARQRPPPLGPLEAGLAGHRARLHRRRDGPRRGVRGRGAGDRDGAAGGSASPTCTGRAAGLGCTGEHRWLGPARGCGRVGVRRGRAERC